MNKTDKAYNTRSITRIIFMIIGAAILIQGALWLADSVYLYKSDMEDIRAIQEDYIQAELKERVASVLDYSDYRSQEIEAVLREELLSRTYEAYGVMESIYKHNKADKSKAEITQMIKDALREIRFNDGRGYFFIDTLEGDVILYPVFAQQEGENVLALQDDLGNHTIQEEIALVKAQREGYIEGYWKNPNAKDDNLYKKITFVKAFEPYGWYLGCGDYLDEITKEIQREVLAYVDSIQYGPDNSQYVFLHDYKGVELANGVYPELVGVNNYDLKDINGARVYQEQIAICKSQAGGYLTHYWPTRDGKGNYKKMTYVAPLAKWEWIIGTGVDVSAIDNMILTKEGALKIFIWKRIGVILLVLALLMLVSMLFVKKFMTKVKKNFRVFRDYMISANNTLRTIDVGSLDYVDFSELAQVTNSMTKRINRLLHYDALTGIYNRRYIMETYEAYLNKTWPMAILSIDLDHFKNVNDQFGHDVGDETLITLARVIQETLPARGLVGRVGGEEFLVILPEMTLEASRKVAETIRSEVETTYIHGIQASMTMSGGLAHSSKCQRRHLLKQGDQKLYEAKADGRNKIKI